MIPKKKISVKAIATKLGASLVGDDAREVSNIAPLESAGSDDLSFLAPGKQYQDLLALAEKSSVGALLVTAAIPSLRCPQIIVPNPLVAIAGLAPLFKAVTPQAKGIHPTAIVAPSASIDPSVSIGAYAVVGEYVEIGKNVTLYPHVVVYDGVRIGDGCVIHSHAVLRELITLGPDCVLQSGAVVGGDGFGYFPEPGVKHHRIPHIGTVVLEEGVDLGANATVDRAMLGETYIGKFTKLDNLVMVGHNTRVGERSLFCAQVGISGSCKIGSDVILAGQTGVADHLTVGDRVRTAGQTGITRSVEANTDFGGTPVLKASIWRRTYVAQLQLPKLLRRMKVVERKLGITPDETTE